MNMYTAQPNGMVQGLQMIDIEDLSREMIPAPGRDTYRQESPYLLNHRNALLERPTLNRILGRMGPLPAQSVFIGQCDDGLPILMDLTDPTAGALLISGEASNTNTRLLRTILASAALLNQVEQVSYSIISPNMGQFSVVANTLHCQAAISSYDRSSSQWIYHLASVAEERKSGRNLGASHILAIDNIEQLLKYEEYEMERYLSWLLQFGPRTGIWTMATSNNHASNPRQLAILSAFGTNISSLNRGRQLAERASSHATPDLDLFTTTSSGQTLRFWIPDLDE